MKTAESVALEPCPLCGESARLTGMNGLFTIHCDHCDFRNHYGGDRDAVIDRWNHRPRESVLEREIERLKSYTETLEQRLEKILGR